MNRLCPVKIECPSPSDSPTLNISSEAPDPLVFTGIVWPNPNPPHCLVDCGLNTIQDCFGVTYSFSSQDEADMLARLIAILCQQDGGNGPITGQQFTNDSQTAFDSCGSIGPGRTFSTVFYTVPAGFVVSPMMDPADGPAWIAASNAAALALAQQRVAGAACCIEPPNSSALNFIVCLNKEFAFGENLYHLTGPNSAAFYTWTISAGSLPPGLTLLDEGFDETVHPRQAIAGIEGTPTANGKYTFTVKATRTDLPNCYVEIPDAMEVFGITNIDTLATTSCKVDNPFSFQFDNSGSASPPYTYSFDPIQPGPSWMTLSTTGLITGTPDTITTHNFGVIITDVNGNTCKYDCTLNVTGPKITLPAAGTVCTAYVGDVVMDPAGSTVVSSSMPVGLTITAAGHITGTPLNTGNLTVTAQDPQGNQNTKTLTPFVTLPAGQDASAAEDIVFITSEILDPGTSTTIDTLIGNHIVITATGACGGGVSWLSGVRIIDGPLRNCSPGGYNLTITVDYNVPTVGPNCGANPHAAGDVTISYDGVGFFFLLLSGSGSVSHTYGVAGSSGSKSVRVSCGCRGADTSTFNVTITPDTPP